MAGVESVHHPPSNYVQYLCFVREGEALYSSGNMTSMYMNGNSWMSEEMLHIYIMCQQDDLFGSLLAGNQQ